MLVISAVAEPGGSVPACCTLHLSSETPSMIAAVGSLLLILRFLASKKHYEASDRVDFFAAALLCPSS